MKARFVKTRIAIIAVLGVAIPAIASVSAADITPEQLSKGDVAHVLAVCTLVLTSAVVSLFWTMIRMVAVHRKEWIERDRLDREDRKRWNDTLNSIIAKCGGPR